MRNGVIVQVLISFEIPTPGLGSQSQWTFIGSDGIVESDLQRAFAQSHAAHRDRQRLTANARFPQKPSHFPQDIVADCHTTI